MKPLTETIIHIRCPGCVDPVPITSHQIGHRLECSDCGARLNTRTDPAILEWRQRQRDQAKRHRAERAAYQKAVFEEAERRRRENDQRQYQQQIEASRKQREADQRERGRTRPVKLREIHVKAAVVLAASIFVGALAALLTHDLIVYIFIQLSIPRYTL